MDTRQIVRYWIKEAQEDIPVADHQPVVLSEKAMIPLRPEQADLLRELMRFNIESRYPKDRESLRQACGRDYTREKLTASRELAQWLIEKTK